jgi:hypothetical protein
MARSPLFGRRRMNFPRIISKQVLGLAVVAAIGIHNSEATGDFGPHVYLDQGGENVEASPEFYWELEVKRLAKGFAPTEKRLAAPASKEETEADDQAKASDDKVDPPAKMTADADTQDFAAALKEGRIKPADSEQAIARHQAARDFIARADDKTTGTLPEEFPSEFADYHRGAFAYRLKKWDEARMEWEALLKRPAEERHYRTVWAAFMLGKAALKTGDPEAVKSFQITRDLAKAGFADSLGMAADSYGWEGRSEWKQNHPEKAARLFLTQLALGDESAIVSLKALIPDRDPVDGMLNYGPEPDQKRGWSEENKKAEEQKALLALKAAAQDPLLRRLVTVHILATESGGFNRWEEDGGIPRFNRCARWLSVIKDAHVEQLEDAEYLGWVAYTKGNYQDAEHWLELAKSDSPVAWWLRAKLQRRAGKLEEAAKSMARAWQSIEPITSYTGWTAAPDPRENEFLGESDGWRWPFVQSAGGDLGALQLERANFIPALEVFLKGGLWDDTAFMAERILTADEIKGYLDRQPATSGTTTAGAEDTIGKLRYLLGRRLVREDRYEEAAPYLKVPYDKVLAHYVQALREGANEKLPKRQRARAWFTAAWLARFDGMELMGTEGAPDGFSLGGDFELPDLAKQRQTGVYQVTQFQNDQEKTVNVPIVLKASKAELLRLAKNRIMPDLRFHYRVIAGALAVRAADLLEDNTEELADVLNTAGLWVKDRDQRVGNRYYQILEKRAAKTKIGSSAIAKHWFVNEVGPWTEEQQVAYKKLHQDLGIDSAQ